MSQASRAARAWRSATRHELAAPAAALVRDADALQRDLPADAPPRFTAAVGNIRTRARDLLDLINRVAGVELSEDDERTARHDLRGHAAYIVGITSLWRDQAAKFGLDRFEPVLANLETTARDVIRLLERLAAEPSADAGLAEVLQYVADLPAPTDHGDLLVVDDNPYNRDYLRDLLAQQGHRPAAAADAAEALDLLDERPFDVILLDVLMPGVSGFALLDRLKADERLKHIPVIMISALEDEHMIAGGIARGAEDYLTRPVNPLLLRARIGASLEKKRLRDREAAHLARIDQLLHAIFPPEVVAELKETASVRPKRFERVGVMFVDVVGFTSYCDGRRDHPEEVVSSLQAHHLAFERIAREHGVQKIKTVGDAFMGAAGLLRSCDNPALTLLHCGRAMAAAARSGSPPWEVRVGIHVGPVVAGVVGETQFSFDLWGDAVNIAARMESSGEPGKITLSAETWRDVAHLARGELRRVEVRGKGTMEVVRFSEFATG